MINDFIVSGKSYKGLNYHEYIDRTKIKLLGTNLNSLTNEEKDLFDYTKLNLQRSLRIEKNYNVSENLRDITALITEEQLWMVITEDWCGDSAQNLPYIYKIAESNPKITIRILLRDSNPEVMDLYLTNGTRSIPKLVAFNVLGNEIFRWGPRPKAVQDLFNRLKAESVPKATIYERMHQWYSKNNGQEVEREFAELLSSFYNDSVTPE